jgi:hypothetical protein
VNVTPSRFWATLSIGSQIFKFGYYRKIITMAIEK